MGPTMTEEYPEIINFTRLCTFFDDVVASTGGRDEVIPMMYFADSTFFDFFNFELISGNPEEVLKAPSSVVLTASIADRLFPEGDPVGQTFKALDGITFTVTGIMVDLPKNTHLDFDALISWSTTGREDNFNVRIYAIDQRFIETYEMNLSEGRNFLENSTADSMNVIVNQTLVDFMGWESGVGKRLRFNEENPYVRIVGVLDDFHYSSLSGTRIEPMVMYLDTEVNSAATIRIGNGDIAETLSHIEASWNKIATRTPFSYQFVENWYANLYNDEIQSLKTASVYSIISIVLCALGLFGLTALALQNKRKEISIRKVLGADRFMIVAMINRQFLLIIGASFFISIPVTYRLIQWWLNQFEYHASLNLVVFILGGVFVIVASMGITSLLALRAASVNPSENLSNE
ncbi:unnamed protein product [Symbiodinium microadriaticum]|nr:unnamed protein product [Symbiodinium microadriaticum]